MSGSYVYILSFDITKSLVRVHYLRCFQGERLQMCGLFSKDRIVISHDSRPLTLEKCASDITPAVVSPHFTCLASAGGFECLENKTNIIVLLLVITKSKSFACLTAIN